MSDLDEALVVLHAAKNRGALILLSRISGSMNQFIPEGWLIAIYCLFGIARFENQRWVRARNGGLRGSNEGAGAFVDATCWLSQFFGIGFLIWFAVQVGWRQALGLLVIGFGCSLLYALVAGDKLWRWVVATLAIWPLMAVLVWITGTR